MFGRILHLVAMINQGVQIYTVGAQHSGKCVLIDLSLHILITQPGPHEGTGSWQNHLLIQFCKFFLRQFWVTSWNFCRFSFYFAKQVK